MGNKFALFPDLLSPIFSIFSQRIMHFAIFTRFFFFLLFFSNYRVHRVKRLHLHWGEWWPESAENIGYFSLLAYHPFRFPSIIFPFIWFKKKNSFKFHLPEKDWSSSNYGCSLSVHNFCDALQICNAVAVAGYLNATLVIPNFHYHSIWRDPRLVSNLLKSIFVV